MADTVYRVITCEDQSLLVADKSGNRIYRINQDRQIEFVLNGTRSQNGFYDAKQMYSGEDGSIYLLVVRAYRKPEDGAGTDLKVRQKREDGSGCV